MKHGSPFILRPTYPFQIPLAKTSLYRRDFGADGILSWFYKSCSSEIAHMVCKIINFSVSLGFVPNVWKHAIVTPVPKCHPVTCAIFVGLMGVLCAIICPLILTLDQCRGPIGD